MRLIDADSLFNWNGKKLSDAVKYGNKDNEQQSWSYSTLMMYEIAGEIDDAPTIEPKRGAWCCVRKSPPEWKCSQCSAYMPSIKNWLEPNPNFCPNCGADMRTEGEA